MGQEISHSSFSDEDFNRFRDRVVAETALLEQWMADGVLDQGEPMAGSEIKAWLVNDRGLPAPVNQAFLEHMNDPMVVPELSTFNVELNTQPLAFSDGMFYHMHDELADLWLRCDQVAGREAAHMLMRCQPWRAKRRLVAPSSREAALLTRRAHSARGEAK